MKQRVFYKHENNRSVMFRVLVLGEWEGGRQEVVGAWWKYSSLRQGLCHPIGAYATPYLTKEDMKKWHPVYEGEENGI